MKNEFKKNLGREKNQITAAIDLQEPKTIHLCAGARVNSSLEMKRVQSKVEYSVLHCSVYKPSAKRLTQIALALYMDQCNIEC